MKLSSIMGRTKKKRQKQGIGPLGRLELKIRENIRAEMCAKWLKRYDRLPADLTGIPRKARTALRRRDAERQAEEERVSQLSEEERAAELRAKQQKEVAAGIEVPGVVVVAGYVIVERTGERIPACEGATLTFGRGLSSDVHIALPRCSRLHAKLTVTRGKQSHVRTEVFLRNRSATDATTRLRHCKTEAWWPLRSNWSAEPISHGDAFEICGERFRYQVARPRCLDDVVRPRVVVSTDLTAEPDAETDDDERPQLPVVRWAVDAAAPIRLIGRRRHGTRKKPATLATTRRSPQLDGGFLAAGAAGLVERIALSPDVRPTNRFRCVGRGVRRTVNRLGGGNF